MSGTAVQLGEASTSTPPPLSEPANERPVVVRVKRKVSQSRLDAFWLEIKERPSKRPFKDLANLSISDPDAGKVPQEFGTKKLLVQHLETVRHSVAIKDVLHSFLQQDSNNEELCKRFQERKRMFKYDKKQDHLRLAARKEHENLGRNARLEQIWKRRGSIDAEEDSLREFCHLYDVVQVDADVETRGRAQKLEISADDDNAILCNYLPLLREFLPEAATAIEEERKENDYVYDLYTVGDCLDANMEDVADYPLVQVNDDENEYYDGSLQSEYDSDDSNAEDNPRNDYPDEESSGVEDENEDPFGDLEGSNSEYEHEEVDIDEDDENWRWRYR
ncbi:RNA-directed DNA methylation 4 isoform X2 [Canna indica]|uniref:RNA-directed DNA methylation 4 isoform X2 n=1 Tax=Canna indica TaxID=4628 RepID=A0AAQ3Q5E1_9LILI|nr:RNA-directed DNA methylation 4 isoform X2 [Canna indica]